MFDKETIIVKSPNGISTRGLVEWLGRRSDADQLEVQSIVYRRGPHSPDEYLTILPISARKLLEEPDPTIPNRSVIDYCVTLALPLDEASLGMAERDYIGTLEEYGDDMYEVSQLFNQPRSHDEIGNLIDRDLQSGRIMLGALTGDLFKGDQ